jgi:hypothetical protein
MRLSRILMLMGALALAAAPAAAQGKAIGKPAGVGKPTTTTVKGASGVNGAGAAAKGKSADAKAGTLAKGKSADHAKGPKTTATDPTITDTDTTVSEESKGRGQLPLGEKIAMNETLTARLEPLLVGTTLTTETATEGWRNQGQFVAAMNAAQREGISFEALRTEMVTNQKSLPDAIAAVKATTTTTTTTTTTPAPPAP